MMTNDVDVVTTSVKLVQTVCCGCGWCVFEKICQGVIALFAVIGAFVAIFRCRIDRGLEAPKLRPVFDNEDRYCHVVDDDVEGGVRCKKVELRVSLENFGKAIANECKILMGDVSLVSGERVLPLSEEGPKDLDIFNSSQQTSCTLRSGEEKYFDLGCVCADRNETKGVDSGSTRSVLLSCIELHRHGEKPIRLLPHQKHVKIPLTICADNFVPKKYIVEIEWSGADSSAIGSLGSLNVRSCEKK